MVASITPRSSRRTPPTDPAGQAADTPQATETAEGEVMTSKFRDALVVGLAQNAILAGLVLIAAGVPTW